MLKPLSFSVVWNEKGDSITFIIFRYLEAPAENRVVTFYCMATQFIFRKSTEAMWRSIPRSDALDFNELYVYFTHFLIPRTYSNRRPRLLDIAVFYVEQTQPQT